MREDLAKYTKVYINFMSYLHLIAIALTTLNAYLWMKMISRRDCMLH
jgi:hypothetical protein